jgi:uncharacterized protein (TIGR02147 family)
MVEITTYMDYREYLRDFFEQKKRELRFYSYRLFSQRAGLKSPNFLKLVIMGERNLSKQSVLKFARALGINKRETEYFENLIFFNQSKTLEEKNYFLGKLMKYREKGDPKKIEEAEYDYYTNWYNPVVRELVCAVDFNDDYKRLGNAVVPAITPAEAAGSLALLQKLKFIVRADDGKRWQKTSLSLTTGQQVRSVAVSNYHRSMISLAGDAIERFGPADRDITSVTLGVSEVTRNAIVVRLAELRRELLELAEQDTSTEQVVQVNFQVFPLSRVVKGNGGPE